MAPNDPNARFGRDRRVAPRSPKPSPDEIRAQRKRDVALGYRLMAVQQWGDTGDGHISARDPEREDCFWLLRDEVSFHEATTSDLVLVGPQGQIVEGEGSINRTAYYIHHPILAARPEIVSAAHTHTGWGTPFSAERRAILPITQESCVFFEDHALFDDDEVQIQSPDGGHRIAAALGENRAVILCNHGLLTVGTCVPESVGSFIMMERVCEAQMKARNARPIPAEAARHAKSDLLRLGAGKISFRSMVARHIGDPKNAE
ncbi:MAG: ribulose phosphate epimerase [bacterium]|nr:ribulose phosphate epimerase [Deltaproteobacteria bacterium]MCP4906197.1 ribulose phosphate epimerase [bacterium]